MKHYDGDSHINVGFDADLPVGELARMICRIVGSAAKWSMTQTAPTAHRAS